MDYPWYIILKNDDEIQQGDLIPDCPIIIPPLKIEADKELDIQVELMNAIVLSQTCDLIHGKVDIVLMCPLYSLKSFVESLKDKKAIKEAVENLRKGFLYSYHLLNNSDVIEDLKDYQVVDFRNVYGVKFDLLKGLIQERESRYRLLPPYREHLSQAFARYFMRVGLPQDIKIEGYY
mgnify:CR=1 FL=1|jgi:hypothetical protein